MKRVREKVKVVGKNCYQREKEKVREKILKTIIRLLNMTLLRIKDVENGLQKIKGIFYLPLPPRKGSSCEKIFPCFEKKNKNIFICVNKTVGVQAFVREKSP